MFFDVMLICWIVGLLLIAYGLISKNDPLTGLGIGMVFGAAVILMLAWQPDHALRSLSGR